MVRRLPAFALLVSLCLAPCMLGAQPAIQPAVDITKVPVAAQPSDHFDADAATDAYMAMMPPAAIARSNAYFEGGYWLILWDFLISSAHLPPAAPDALVRAHARPGRAHHALPLAAEHPLLAAIPGHHVHPGFPAGVV